jgi:outer membrane protein assembly factor BamA
MKAVRLIDITDIYKEIFEKKTKAKDTSVKKKKEFYSVLPAAGYAMSTGLTAVLSSSVSFFLDTNKSKLSTISANAYYTVYNQYWLQANSNITDDDLKLNFTGDWRIYKFPTNTFGLGTDNNLSDALRIDFAYLKFYEVASREIEPNFFVGLGYHLDYHWDIKAATSPDSTYENVMDYGLNKQSITSGLSLNFMYDNRENPTNPSNGIYAAIQFRSNNKVIGSDYNSQSILIDVRKYIKLPFNSDNVLAFWSYNSLTISGRLPYLDLPSTGWDASNNTGRGYIQGRYRGNDFVDLEGEYRFKITNNGLLGGVVFANAESVSEFPTNKLTTIMIGKGLGLRIKINKNSRSNLCVDYGIGQGNSHGFSFNLGEVF